MSTHPSLRDALGDYLALRRALGFKLANAGRLLGQFVHYLDGHGAGLCDGRRRQHFHTGADSVSR